MADSNSIKSAVREQLVAAVDDWAVWVGKEEPARRAWFLAVARAADPDPVAQSFSGCGGVERPHGPGTPGPRGEGERTVPANHRMHWGRYWCGNADAMPLLTTAQRRYPSDFWLNLDLGAALHDARRWDEAIGYYRAASGVASSTSAVYNNLGIALQENGRVDEAIAEYQKAVELDPKNVYAHNNLANARDKGREDEAIAEYQKAIQLDPKSACPHTGLGNALLEGKRRVDEAIAE